jgi:ubiquinone/menaquinone biosynthesis C-methylase UbiE
VAQKLGVRLVGMDLIDEAIVQAAALKARFDPVDAQFRTGSFTDTQLADRSIDGVMSIDAYWMVLDKRAAVREMHRILKPGGRFVMTTWAPAYLDPATTLAKNGFEVVARRETPNWKARQLAVYEQIRNRRDALTAELGDAAMQILLSEAENAPAMIDSAPRVLVVAQKP